MDAKQDEMEVDSEQTINPEVNPDPTVNPEVDEIKLEDYPDTEEEEDFVISVPKIVLRESAPTKPDPISDEEQNTFYQILGIPIDPSDKKLTNWRLNVVHLRGVQEMSTEDVLDYFNYEPHHIEWVNDMACNVIFSDPKAAATAFFSLSAALVLHKSETVTELPPGLEVIDANNLEVSVPPYRWRLGKKSEKAKCLLLRFATTADKKMMGARKHSQYYQKYGLPPESNRIIKHKKPRRVSSNAPKLRDNLERSLYIKPNPRGLAMQMRADEEEAKRSLSDRLAIPLSRRASVEEGERASVWDRLENLDQSPRSVSRRVEVGRDRLRVISRFSKPRRGPLSRRVQEFF